MICSEQKCLETVRSGIEIKSSRWEVFCKKGIPKYFKIFSGKHLCQSQESLVNAISCEFCGIFTNFYFVEPL